MKECVHMDKFNKIEGQEGLFEIKKVKLMYEVIPLEKGFLKKNLNTREIKIFKEEKENGK